MEEKFWTWYEKQGFPWSPEIFWDLPNRDTLLMGMVIRYLYEAGVAIPAKKFQTFEEMLEWYKMGVTWGG